MRSPAPAKWESSGGDRPLPPPARGGAAADVCICGGGRRCEPPAQAATLGGGRRCGRVERTTVFLHALLFPEETRTHTRAAISPHRARKYVQPLRAHSPGSRPVLRAPSTMSTTRERGASTSMAAGALDAAAVAPAIILATTAGRKKIQPLLRTRHIACKSRCERARGRVAWHGLTASVALVKLGLVGVVGCLAQAFAVKAFLADVVDWSSTLLAVGRHAAGTRAKLRADREAAARRQQAPSRAATLCILAKRAIS